MKVHQIIKKDVRTNLCTSSVTLNANGTQKLKEYKHMNHSKTEVANCRLGA